MTSVILAVDPGVHQLGLATCGLLSGDPVWCGSLSISRATGGWRHQQIGHALRLAATSFEPALVAIEDPTHASRGKRQAAQWGEIIGLVEAEARRRWPHAPVWRISPPGWKKPVVGSGNADAERYTRHAMEAGWPVPAGDHDAAAAACICMWAWQTNMRGVAA